MTRAALADAVIAARAARLCQAAEASLASARRRGPGVRDRHRSAHPRRRRRGARAAGSDHAGGGDRTLDAHRAALGTQAGPAWARVVALVVQPGVEFDHHKVIDYAARRRRAQLARRIESEPGLVYEAHSTDYQTPAALAALVRDHFAILKVGPGVTFALRAALWALADIQARARLATRSGR